MFSHSKKEHIRNVKKCSQEIRTDPTFQVKITTELLGVFWRSGKYCWILFWCVGQAQSLFYLFNRHLVMAPFRNTKKLQNYACSSNHLQELEKPSDVQGEGGDCHTPLRFSWVFSLDDKTSAANIFSSCSLSLARILRQVQWWSVSMVSRYDVISSKCSSHFWVKICFISTSINNRSKSCAKCLFMCYFSCQGQKIIISRGFSRV